MTEVRHRSDQGIDYSGLAIHAAPGVHEFVGKLIAKRVPRGARVLDLGSGSGALALRLKDLGYDVTAMDLSPASSFIRGIRVVQGDICSVDGIPAALGKFDCIAAVELIEHLPNLELGLRNIAGALGASGHVVVTTPNVQHPVARLRFLLSGAPSYFGVDAFYQTGHRNILPDWLVRVLLKEQRLEVSDVFRCGTSDRSERGVALSRLSGLVGRALSPDRWFDHGRISVFAARAVS